MERKRGAAGAAGNHAVWFVALAWIVAAVNDGWSGRPSPFAHQLLLLPFSAGFAVALFLLLRTNTEVSGGIPGRASEWFVPFCIATCVLFELGSLCGFLYERHHFARFGYGFSGLRGGVLVAVILLAAAWGFGRRTAGAIFGADLVVYTAGVVFAIVSFPLNYLRSDMLPVIIWSDQRLVRHLNPYATIHIGSRLYDFPYLPGMLVAYLPAIALHVDVRFVNLLCVLGMAALIYWAADQGRRLEAAGLLGVYLLSPFMQYRHDIYLAPHWWTLAGVFVLMLRGRYVWAAVVFGVSMAIYQLSWVLFPFFLLHAFRRKGWPETLKLGVVGVASMLAVLGPFLAEATRRIASNTVGQWSRLPHALADPINVSYWLTFLVRPDELKWLQLAAMTAIFLFCVFRGRCATLTDTLRWMSGALALFIAMNVLVDGYFYLTLLLLLLMFTCAATGVWQERMPEMRARSLERSASVG